MSYFKWAVTRNYITIKIHVNRKKTTNKIINKKYIFCQNYFVLFKWFLYNKIIFLLAV